MPNPDEALFKYKKRNKNERRKHENLLKQSQNEVFSKFQTKTPDHKRVPKLTVKIFKSCQQKNIEAKDHRKTGIKYFQHMTRVPTNQ